MSTGARAGVDVGGTFTDLVALDETGTRIVYHKTPSTPSAPSQAIAAGLANLLSLAEVDPTSLAYLGHGTTVATNMVIEHQGAITALVTTRGFRDILEIGRQTRPNLYNYRHAKPTPLSRRAHRLEITERLSPQGEIITPLDDMEVDAIAQRLRALGIQAVAIALLHAYRNPVHEEQVEARLRRALPGVFICRSSEVLPEFREFERTSTTTLNAFVGPRMEAYIQQLLDRTAELGLRVAPHTIQSNGGLMSVDAVRRFPVRTCLSGPAAGVVAAAAIGTAANERDLIAFDVGGTSTDGSLIIDGAPAITAERPVAGHPVRSPMIDVHVIGAGGGSIAHIDSGGALKVGPRSAGATPGPVAYGQGGSDPTLTDANIVLGRLNPIALLDGRMPIEAQAAHSAIEAQLAKPLALDTAQAASGVIAVAVANIARAIRSVSTERGHDPTELSLLAYGGAGPLHAVAVAREVECRRVLVPVEPGTLCARGILLSDLRTDLVRSLVTTANAPSWKQVRSHYADLFERASQWCAEERLSEGASENTAIIEARYDGQSFEIPVLLPADFFVGDAPPVDAFIELFHVAHERVYGYRIQGREVVIVNCRLQVTGVVPKAPLRPTKYASDAPPTDQAGALIEKRRVYLDADLGFADIPVYRRPSLSIGATIEGPAIVQEMSSTTFIGPGDVARVDPFANLIIDIGE